VTQLRFQRLDKRGRTKIVASNGARSFTIQADLREDEGRMEAISKILAKLPGLDREQLADALEAEAAREEPAEVNAADRLLRHLREPGRVSLFHSADGEAFALVNLGGVGSGGARHETLRVRSLFFRDWLARLAYSAGFKAPSSDTLQTVTSTLAAEARFGAPELPVFVRLGEHQGAIYLDLANEGREIVRITGEGWTVRPANEAPVRMVRSRGMLALPMPERRDPKEAPAGIERFRRFLNVDDVQWTLVRGFLIGMLRPRGPHAALVLTAEHGCGKSWLAEAVRRQVDPNIADNRRPPKDERDLAIAARNGHVISLNNLSGIQPWLSDALCSVLDGGGLSTRELHTDADETIFAGARPVILNGIEDVATRPDLADRAVHIALRRMDEGKLMEEEALRADLKIACPVILGALLDAVACGLRRWNEVKLNRKPRRLDFARWVEAAAPALGLKPGEFLSAYVENRAGASAAALEASPCALAIRDLVEQLGEWRGSATELLQRVTTEERKRVHGWPSTARKLSSVLRTFAPCLRANGIEVLSDGKDSGSRRSLLHLRKVAAQPFEPFGSSASASVTELRTVEARDPKLPKDCAPPMPDERQYATEERAALHEADGPPPAPQQCGNGGAK
jgi:hypothetical protein